MSLNLQDPPPAAAPPDLYAVVRGRLCPEPAAMIEAALRVNRQVNAMRRVARQWPRTRPISLNVARYMTPFIPDANGQPLFNRALTAAVQHTLACIAAHPGRALDAESLRTFVTQLCQPLPAVLQCAVNTPDQACTWDPLAEDLYDWLRTRERIVIRRTLTPLDRTRLPGFYTVLLPRLLAPEDLWYMRVTPPELVTQLLSTAG